LKAEEKRRQRKDAESRDGALAEEFSVRERKKKRVRERK
jgi:hypothetical protein